MGLLFLSVAGSAFAADHVGDMTVSLDLFKSDVRGILVEHCVDCHGGKKLKSEFSLATREGLLRGGEQGTAVVLGQGKDSALFQMMTHELEPPMPHKRDKLSAEDIHSVGRWIDTGAAYSAPLVANPLERRDSGNVTDGDKDFWSFAPLRVVAVPHVKGGLGVRTDLDRFIRAKQERVGVMPAQAIGRRKLIRRVYFDLIGLPPTPEQVSRFVNDTREGSYERLVDDVLSSPHYGERWGRHWLDVARWGESDGFEHDSDRKHAFHYRDFVIQALNEDMPYTTFVKWQLAGDELEPDNVMAMKATGFLGAGVYPTQITVKDAERVRYDALDDMSATMSSAMLGLTLGCARCHDHKFDPIPTLDYYRLSAAFSRTVRAEVSLPIAPVEGGTGVVQTATVQVCAEGYRPMRRHVSDKKIKDFFDETYVLNRGDVEQKGEVAVPGFLRVLMRGGATEERWKTTPPAEAKGSFRRVGVAKWITDVDHGAGNLLARVMANRVWQHHFGRGLVSTPNDFGHQGEPPTHPDLLEWLAGELIRNGWRLKSLHKTIMLSATYQQGNQRSELNESVDVDNQLYWKRVPRRQEAEVIRDTVLSVGDLLDDTLYGAGSLDSEMKRRAIYFQVKRSRITNFLQVFDYPGTLESQGARQTTATAPQSLVMMNSPLVRAAATGLAERASAVGTDPAKQIVRAYLWAFGRAPSAFELKRTTAFLAGQESGRAGLTRLCHALLCQNEFIFVE